MKANVSHRWCTNRNLVRRMQPTSLPLGNVSWITKSCLMKRGINASFFNTLIDADALWHKYDLSAVL